MAVKKYLTIEEAQKLVPEVRKSILKIMKLNTAIELLGEIEVTYPDETESVFSEIKFNKKFHSLCFRLFTHLENLMEKGAVLDNIEKGAINFFSIHNNKPVVLCWKLGDKRIKYWYGIDEDFSEKKPLSLLR